MTEQQLIQMIYKKCNDYAMMTGLHTGNVAYVPEIWKSLCVSESWKPINGKLVLQNMITVFFKPVDLIFVNYMKNPEDEMRNIPTAAEETKHRSFVKIGSIRVDVGDIVAYYTQGREELYINLRYSKDTKCIHETPDVIRQAVIDLDKYFGVQTIL